MKTFNLLRRIALVLMGTLVVSFASAQSESNPKTSEMTAEELFLKGDAYFFGQGVPANYHEAMRWYKKAAEKGHTGAMFNIGFMYQFGLDVAIDDHQAMKWYKKAKDQGNLDALVNIGYMYEHGQEVKTDYTQAMNCFQEAADQGHACAMVRLHMVDHQVIKRPSIERRI